MTCHIGTLSCASVLLLATTHLAWALDADQVRGGWETLPGQHHHMLELSIRGRQVTGVACSDCTDASTLAYVEGMLEDGALRFVIDHVRDDGSIYRRDVLNAYLEGTQLIVSGQEGPERVAVHWSLRKDPRGPGNVAGVPMAVLPQAGAPAANVAAYGTDGQPPKSFRAPAGQAAVWKSPGPWEQLSPAKLVGAWFIGVGAGKQYFVIRRVRKQLFGLVCGPCDNPYSMAALDGFQLEGDTLRFDIDHEDWGFGKLPFHNEVVAKVTHNEMRLLSVVQDNLPPQPGPGFTASLIGPVAVEATSSR